MSVKSGEANNARSSPWAENLKTIAYALLIAILIRIFLFQPFNIPSGSMIPNLLVGDFLFVSKYSYGLSRHSFPFSPSIFSGRFLGAVPDRGDVVVFKLPSDGRTDYIKRVIGLPGDRLQMIQGVLHINNVPVSRQRVDDFVVEVGGGKTDRIPQYLETLPNGVSYATLDINPNGRGDNTRVFSVPPGHLFMMGDNRDNSSDSRFDVRYVPFENLVGKARILFFSTDGSARLWQFWKWPTATRWSRLFNGVE